uniref:Putative secreted protein n=1 Tax=Rhipicephalus microplus TaxID=6941 RepID=A0A6G5A0P4_RHIMP
MLIAMLCSLLLLIITDFINVCKGTIVCLLAQSFLVSKSVMHCEKLFICSRMLEVSELSFLFEICTGFVLRKIMLCTRAQKQISKCVY